MSALVSLFLAFDLTIKFLHLPVVVETTTQLGWPESTILPMAILLAIATILYVVPGTAVLGAIVLTGYLGGAVATHVRIGSPLFTHVLFGVYLGVLMWGGLWFREPRLRALLQFRS